MIRQKVKLLKLTTADGHFDFTGRKIKVGYEFWIDVQSYQITHYRRPALGNEIQSALMVKAHDIEDLRTSIKIPVEVLSFTSEFEVDGES
jgi:hypothetical protein